MTTTITQRTELAHRASGGIEVYLFWNEPTSRVTVGVHDARTDDSFELEVDGRHALDAFNHPYSYASKSGSDPAEQAINPRRTEHASTDR